MEILPVQCNTFPSEGDWFCKRKFFIIDAITCIEALVPCVLHFFGGQNKKRIYQQEVTKSKVMLILRMSPRFKILIISFT